MVKQWYEKATEVLQEMNLEQDSSVLTKYAQESDIVGDIAGYTYLLFNRYLNVPKTLFELVLDIHINGFEFYFYRKKNREGN